MDSLIVAFEVVVLSLTALSVLAVAAFIWSDARADRRATLSARTPAVSSGADEHALAA